MQVRYYQESDYEGIVELASHIWDGHDYLPRMINRYHTDSHSYPIVVEIDHTIAAFGNMRLITPNIAWLEAIRTHPDYRGRGLSKLITNKHFELAKELHVKHFWLSTDKDNVVTRSLLVKYGFHELLTTRLWHDQQVLQQSQNQAEWQICKDQFTLTSVARQLRYDIVLGEFKVLPIDAYEIQQWLQQSEIYVVPNGIMSIRPSYEDDTSLIIGINADKPEIINAGMNFVFTMIKNNQDLQHKSLKLFYPGHVTSTNFPTEREFRIMEFSFA